ncbi:hypothetical protein [Exiguobacterium sp. S22-S28]|uniref:hypothetical protein n=1 Tax=Exiguobacterium sp. S22-S28 TaxID=3342768 RepID=UPI00372D56FB
MIDINNHHNQLIVAALAGMVEDEGLTPREAFIRLDEIKKDTYSALMEIHSETKEAKR